MKSAVVACPAKVNLFLAVTGRREDGFHDLVSLVAQTAVGDTLRATWTPESGPDTLTCDDPALPTDETNLVLRAAQLARARREIPGRFAFHLEKRLPSGAGLGGGSSDGVGALRLIQRLTGALAEADLAALASQLGSDCPLFLDAGPKVIRGRGEHVTRVPLRVARGLAGRRVILAQPSVAVSTPWAYGQLAARAQYTPPARAEAEAFRLQERLAEDGPGVGRLRTDDWTRNDFLPVVGAKFLTIPLVIAALNQVPGVRAGMSGSGSAVFALIDHHVAEKEVIAVLRDAWGPHAWLVATTLR